MRQRLVEPSQFSAPDNLDDDFANRLANSRQFGQVSSLTNEPGNILFQALNGLSGPAVCLELEPVGAFQRKSSRIAAQDIRNLGIGCAHDMRLTGGLLPSQ